MVAGTCEEYGVLAGVGEPSALSSCCYRLAGARSTWCLHERQVDVECLERACPGLLVRHAQEPQPGASLEPAWSQTHGLGKVGGLVARCRTMPGPRIS